jgi:hypothetical protein
MPFESHDSIYASSTVVRKLHSLPFTPRLLGAAALLITLLTGAIGAQAAAAYQNPFAGEQPYVGRTDMGVDLCLSPGQPIRAVGNGVVIGIIRNWSEGQPYVWYQLTGGANAGRYVYVAEQIKGLPRVGQSLHAGDVVARYAVKGTCIETGWGAANGQTLAQATTGYVEGRATVAGVSFARFLMSLGVQGAFDLAPARATRAHPTKRKPGRRPAKKTGTKTPSSGGAAAIGAR